ncbi:type II toxin-antitoxin system BrnA family antitoxin [Adlercreutzia faecimuris]|uniref:CopG family transcriptional regulator n=1 Tax=Adlercreutzia faecimuris TaxID=2897341 RepID=A0ABS9WH74_9ACTN|nr:CopG family transcriptional regulator [Adlercreutzia sp. JBNU-10]MCI2241832.1 CopG family transcriptional regulator [Adlercreutzia sp. JBNU-10]
MTARETPTASEIDRMFDEGVDMTPYVIPGTEICAATARKVGVTMSPWMIEELDREADRLAVSRQSLIVIWLAERIQEERERRGRLAEG